MSVTGCLVSDMLLGKQCLNESAIIAGGGGRSEEHGEMTAVYRYSIFPSRDSIFPWMNQEFGSSYPIFQTILIQMGKRESRYVTDLGKEIRDLMILIILMT